MSSPRKPYRNPKTDKPKEGEKKAASEKKVPASSGKNFISLLISPAAQLNRKTHLLIAMLVFVMGFLLYANTISHDYALDDDLVYKLNSTVKKGLSGIHEVFRTTNMYGFNQQNYGAYRPFTQMLFAIEYQFFGLNPHMQHFFSVLLFALTSLLLYLLMKRIFRDKPLWISVAITLIFIAHPIHTEVVANIKSRDELISFLFGFVLTFLFLFRYIDTHKIFWLLLSLICFLAGLMSKEHIITLLPVIPLTIYFFSDKKPKQILFTSLWFLLPAALFLLLRATLTETAAGKIVFLDNFVIHIPTFTDKAGTILYILLDYLRLFVFPFPQSCDYTWAQTPQLSMFSILPVISFIIYLGLFVLAILLFRKKNLISWCILFFLFTISIYSHVYAGLAATMAERFLFTPSLPLIIALVVLLYQFSERIKNSKSRMNLILIPVILVFVIFGIKTIARNTVWKNSDTLFMNDVTNAPKSARLNKSAGDVLINLGKNEKDTVKKKHELNEALKYLMIAYNIYPDYPDNLLDLGTAWFFMNDLDSSWKYWKRFAEVQPWSPRTKENLNFLSTGFYNQGLEFSKQNNLPGALNAFTKSLQFDSTFHASWFNLALVQAGFKNYAESKKCFEHALRLDPSNAEYWYNYGGLLFTVNDYNNARNAWEKTLQLSPGHKDAMHGLGAIKGK